ncbi:hypothetical protein ACRQ5B_05020 [Pseudarthrobacter sp. L19]
MRTSRKTARQATATPEGAQALPGKTLRQRRPWENRSVDAALSSLSQFR